jgi:hypothetical protein
MRPACLAGENRSWCNALRALRILRALRLLKALKVIVWRIVNDFNAQANGMRDSLGLRLGNAAGLVAVAVVTLLSD